MAMIECNVVERYVAWQAMNGVQIQDFSLARLCFEASDLVLLLSVEPHRRLLRILFEAPIAFRSIGESYRLKTWTQAEGSLLGLHLVQGSMWVQWLREESGGVLAETSLTHFAVITADDCVDVVTEFAPIVQWADDLREEPNAIPTPR